MKRQLYTLQRFQITGLVFLLGLFGPLTLQRTDAQTHNFKLEKIDIEIRSLRKTLKAKENKEKSLLEQLEDIEREIGLMKILIAGLEQEIRQKNREIQKTQDELARAMARHERLKQIVAGRMVSMYKHGQVSDWKALFTLSDFNQAMVWIRYQKRIIENDKRNLDQLREVARQIEDKERTLRSELASQKQLKAENERESRALVEKKAHHENLLTEVRKSIEAEREQLRLKEQADREIRQQIAEAKKKEQSQKQPSQLKTANIKFSSLRGKMGWPVKGPVVTRYGLVENQKLKMITENFGIEIQGPSQGNVHCVCAGQVTKISWMRGKGNIIMVSHGNDYRTVYSLIDVVNVQEGDWVEMGGVIGKVGSRKSLYRSNLEFQVWKGLNSQNPIQWLKRG